MVANRQRTLSLRTKDLAPPTTTAVRRWPRGNPLDRMKTCPMEHSERISENQATDLMGDDLSRDRPKVRNCLRCSVEFESAWSGERICKRCKGSNEWKSNGYR